MTLSSFSYLPFRLLYSGFVLFCTLVLFSPHHLTFGMMVAQNKTNRDKCLRKRRWKLWRYHMYTMCVCLWQSWWVLSPKENFTNSFALPILTGDGDPPSLSCITKMVVWWWHICWKHSYSTLKVKMGGKMEEEEQVVLPPPLDTLSNSYLIYSKVKIVSTTRKYTILW